jgi:hypothetical protein
MEPGPRYIRKPEFAFLVDGYSPCGPMKTNKGNEHSNPHSSTSDILGMSSRGRSVLSSHPHHTSGV